MVKETAIQLQGYSAPGAFILVSEDTDVVGAGTADSVTGEFNFFLTALQAGVPHSIVLVAASQDQVTPGMGFVVQPVAHSVVSVSNIVLPPFIDVTPSAADSGVPITVSGQSTPGGDITLFVEPGSLNTTTVVDANGDWSVELIGEFGTLAQGTYTASATVTISTPVSARSH